MAEAAGGSHRQKSENALKILSLLLLVLFGLLLLLRRFIAACSCAASARGGLRRVWCRCQRWVTSGGFKNQMPVNNE